MSQIKTAVKVEKVNRLTKVKEAMALRNNRTFNIDSFPMFLKTLLVTKLKQVMVLDKVLDMVDQIYCSRGMGIAVSKHDNIYRKLLAGGLSRVRYTVWDMGNNDLVLIFQVRYTKPEEKVFDIFAVHLNYFRTIESEKSVHLLRGIPDGCQYDNPSLVTKYTREGMQKYINELKRTSK